MWVLAVGLTLMVMLILLRLNIIIAAPVCIIVIAWLSGFTAIEMITGPYAAGLADFINHFFFIFLLGAVFGKLISASGAAEALGCRMIRLFSPNRAASALLLTSALLTYGGIPGFVAIFTL